MLGYRHAFHAGNFADVFKHVVLVRVLDYLAGKDAPLLYLDTHAGAGTYALGSPQAQRTGEYRQGVALLWREAGLPAPLKRYVELIRSFNGDGALRIYPGSPRIAATLLRRQDRLDMCELHQADFALLESAFRDDGRVQSHPGDGFKTALARLPPRERRGLVFIDPSYELYIRGRHGTCARRARAPVRRPARCECRGRAVPPRINDVGAAHGRE